MTEAQLNYHNSFAGKGVLLTKYDLTLLWPIKNLFLYAKKLLQRLDFKKNHILLEIRPSYFNSPIAQHLPQSKLVLLDMQTEMLTFAKKHLGPKKIKL